MLAALPVDKVAPTPFQRDISDAHVRRLTQAMDKTKRFLDPIIAVREPQQAAAPGATYWTPNGYHRLTALKELGAKSILALLVPERPVAYQILALNIEKAHNLREKAIGVRRMYVDLAPDRRRTARRRSRSSSRSRRSRRWASPTRSAGGSRAAPTTRCSGRPTAGCPASCATPSPSGARGPRRCSTTTRRSRRRSPRSRRAGFNSPYLRNFVVARTNPLRFIKGEPPPVDELLATMTKRARGMDASKIKTEDVARSGGAPEAAE